MQSFCRTCFLEISDTSSSAPLNCERYKRQLLFCVPEMDLRTFPNAKLCEDCVAALDVTYKFKIKCHEPQSIKQEISLNNVIRTLCRICVKDDFLLPERQFYKSKLIFCVPEMDLQFVSDIKLCNNCCIVLDKIYVFKMKCLDVEKNIKKYLKSHDAVDLKDLSVWCNAFVKCEALGLKECMIKQETIDLDYKMETTEDVKGRTIKNELLISLKTEELKVCNCRENCKCNNVERLLPDIIKHDYGTVQKYNLSEHICPHTSGKPFKCSLCGYCATQKSHLDIHVRTHTGEKPFKCFMCEYSAAQKSTLIVHIRTHTGERPFKCSFCAYSAAHVSALRKHVRTHTGEKPFKCLLCKYRSAHKSNFNKHILTHIGEKSFKCSLCKFSAAQLSTLDQHICTRAGKNS